MPFHPDEVAAAEVKPASEYKKHMVANAELRADNAELREVLGLLVTAPAGDTRDELSTRAYELFRKGDELFATIERARQLLRKGEK